MNRVLEQYENKYDYMYLFANESVLDFYPKFGFKPVEEHLFSMDYTAKKRSVPADIRKLDVTNTEDVRLLSTFASERRPVSQHFATAQTKGILMFYCLNVFSHDIYYLEKENVIVVYQKEGNTINLFDVISLNEIHMTDILHQITDEDTQEITFHFTPDPVENMMLKSTITNEGLFVKPHGEKLYPVHVKHPITSIA